MGWNSPIAVQRAEHRRGPSAPRTKWDDPLASLEPISVTITREVIVCSRPALTVMIVSLPRVRWLERPFSEEPTDLAADL